MNALKIKIPQAYQNSFFEDFNPQNANLVDDCLVIKRKQSLCVTYANRVTKKCGKNCPFYAFSKEGTIGCLEWFADLLGDPLHFRLNAVSVWWQKENKIAPYQLRAIRKRAPDFIEWI